MGLGNALATDRVVRRVDVLSALWEKIVVAVVALHDIEEYYFHLIHLLVTSFFRYPTAREKGRVPYL